MRKLLPFLLAAFTAIGADVLTPGLFYRSDTRVVGATNLNFVNQHITNSTIDGVATSAIATNSAANKLDITNGTAVGLTLNGTTTIGASAGKIIFAQPQSGDDTAYLQGLLDSISAVPGTLVLAPGTYQVEGQGLTNYSNVRIVGYGATLSRSDTTEAALTLFAGTTNCLIEGLAFYAPTPLGTGTGANGAAIRMDGAAHVKVVNCRFERHNYSVYANGCSYITVSGCDVYAAARTGIYLIGCSQYLVDNNRVFGDRDGVGSAVDTNIGIWAIATTGEASGTNGVVRANYVTDTYNEGINIRGQRLVVSDNQVYRALVGTAGGASYAMSVEGTEIESTAFTADAGTDTLTATNHGLAIGDAVQFYATGEDAVTALPAPLFTGQIYYVLTVPTTNTLTLSASPTAAAVTLDITDAGTAGTNGAFYLAHDTLHGIDIVVRNNFMWGSDGGMRVSADPVNLSLGNNNILVAGNTVDNQVGTSLHCFTIGSARRSARDVDILVTGNTAKNSRGIGFYVPQAAHVRLANNRALNLNNNGITVGGPYLASKEINVSFNDVRDVDGSGMTFTAVTGGHVIGNRLSNINRNGGTDYGMNFASGATTIPNYLTTLLEIQDNTVSDSPLATYAFRSVSAGTNRFFRNYVIGDTATPGTPNSLNSTTITEEDIILPTPELALGGGSVPTVGQYKYWGITSSTRTLTGYSGALLGQLGRWLHADSNTTYDFSGSDLIGNGGLDYRALSGDAGFGFVDANGDWQILLNKKNKGASIWRGVTPVTVANTTSATTLLSSSGAFGTLTLPGNYLRDGKMMYVRAWGTYGTKGSNVGNLKLQVSCQASAAIGDTGNFVLPPSMSGTWEMQFWWHPLNTGGSVSVARGGAVTFETGSGFSTRLPLNDGGSVTISTTVARTLDFTAQWGTADASNTITCSGLEFQSSYD